jgi:hypothetical protein
MSRALLVVALLLPAGACASAQAKPPIESVWLEVPPVPPRLIDPAPVEPPPIPLVEELELAPPSPLPARPRPAARETTRSEPKAEPKPENPDPGPVALPLPPPVAPLRTQASANGPEADRQIREMLDRASRLLEMVDLRGMSEDRRAAFDSAKDSITRAYDALKAFNVVLARSLAERAENFARLLTGRQLPH